MSDNLTLRVRNAVEDIEPASRTAEDWLQKQGLPENVRYLVNLAVEELVTNCIKHGYDDTDEHSIEFVLSVGERTLTILAVDDGRAFDASKVPPPDLSQAIEHRPVGGLGIHLLHELTDMMSYERRDGKNRLTLIKRLA